MRLRAAMQQGSAPRKSRARFPGEHPRGHGGPPELWRGLFARHEALIPTGPARDTILEWIEQGLHVEIYLQMAGTEPDSGPGTWMIRVGDRELSVEEYLDLF